MAITVRNIYAEGETMLNFAPPRGEDSENNQLNASAKFIVSDVISKIILQM